MSDSLGEFLRARRARLTRADVGLPATAQSRRVPGLRREEVAQLASISTDYYRKLEQGRIAVTPPVLASIATALRLTADASHHLHELAGLAVPPRPPAAPLLLLDTDAVELAKVQSVIDSLHLSPAFVIGPRSEILAWNTLSAAMVTDFSAIPVEDRYYIRLLITDPAMRTLYSDWPDVTRLAVEQIRHLSGREPDDPILNRLVRELSALDADFEQWWASHEVAARTAGMKVLRHPVVGELHLEWSAMTWNTRPEWQVIVWQAHAGTPTRQRLELLDRHSRTSPAVHREGTT